MKKVRTRLADRHKLIWFLLDGMTKAEWQAINDPVQRQAKFLKRGRTNHAMGLFDPREDDFTAAGLEPPPDPAFPTGVWSYAWAVFGCKTFDTPTLELGPHEMWQDAERIVWKDDDVLGYKEALLQDVVIEKVGNTVTGIQRKVR